MVSDRVRTRPPSGMVGELWLAYSAGWTVILTVGAVCALMPFARWLAAHGLGLPLHDHLHPTRPPALSTAIGLFARNLVATGWPLLAVALGADRLGRTRWLVHAAVVWSVAKNVLPVAAAIGLYGTPLLRYLPHLPFELYADTTGPAAWWMASRQTLTRRQLRLIAFTMVIALTVAAGFETWAVPHR